MVISGKDRSAAWPFGDGPERRLLGRDLEMAALEEALETARSGSAVTVLVGGEAGIGKTTLLSEFVARSPERLLWGGCLPLGERGVPYLALIEMLRSLDDTEREALPPALQALAPRSHDVSPKRAANRSQLFQAVIEYFESLASVAPLIVVVEDLHWADRSTRDLLDFLIALMRDKPILMVATFRTDDLVGDHPLRIQLAEWLRRASVRRLDLDPLTSEDGLRLIASLIADPELTQDQAMRLVERADGNPFFLEELAAAGPSATGTPTRMKELLLRRTSELSPDLLRLLRIASAGGTAIDEDLLSRVAELGIDQTRALLRDAIQAQLLALDERGCRFRHALVAEAVHDDLLPAERRAYHALYADALQSRSADAAPGELASHQEESGRVAEALGSWVAAAKGAEAHFAFAEAQHGYQSALDLWDSVEDSKSRAGLGFGELLRRLAEAAFLGGDASVACRMARRALDEIDPGRDPVAAGLLYHSLARYLRPTDESGQALAIQQRAVDLIPASPPSPERAEVLSGLALMLQYENRYHEARDVGVEAIELAVETGAVDAEIRGRNTLGNAICTIESVDRGLSMIEEALDLARQTGNAHEQARSLWNLQANRFLGCRLSEYVDNSSATFSSLRITQPHWVVDQMVHTADALQMLGRWDEADAMIEAARREYPTLASRIGVPELHIARGHFDEARTVVEARDTPVLARDVTANLWNLVNLAQIEAVEGKPSAAIDLIDQAILQYPSLDKPTVISHAIATGLRAAADVAREARIKGKPALIAEVIDIGDRLYQRMAEVMAQPGPPDGWKLEVGCLGTQCDAERSRLHGQPDPEVWQRSADQWSALSMPYRSAYCRFRFAENALASGAKRAAVESKLAELLGLLTGLGAEPLLVEVRALARRAGMDLEGRQSFDPYGLTGREREVLTHVATGSTNRQIAEILYISEKTASVHVSNILRKLAATNRGEAAAKAIREGIVDLVELEWES